MANTTYVTVSDIRSEGLSDTTAYPDASVQAALNMWAAFIEHATGRFFDVRAATLLMDGNDTETLFLPVPVITVTKLFMNGHFTDPTDIIDPVRYMVYNRIQAVPSMGQDDRDNPKIRLITNQVDFYQMAAFGPTSSRGFIRGSQNQKITGTFGFTEDGTTTPLLIKRALTKLVLRNIDKLAAGGVPIDPNSGQKGQIISESTDGHSISYQAPKKQNPLIEITGDPEVNQILRMYHRPMAIRVTGTFQYAGQYGG